MSSAVEIRGSYTCEVCALTYLIPEDNRERARVHRQFLKLSDRYAVPRFGPFLWGYEEREANKQTRKPELIMYAHFCRSVLAMGKLTHPDFEEYVRWRARDKSGSSYWGDAA